MKKLVDISNIMNVGVIRGGDIVRLFNIVGNIVIIIGNLC